MEWARLAESGDCGRYMRTGPGWQSQETMAGTRGLGQAGKVRTPWRVHVEWARLAESGDCGGYTSGLGWQSQETGGYTWSGPVWQSQEMWREHEEWARLAVRRLWWVHEDWARLAESGHHGGYKRSGPG